MRPTRGLCLVCLAPAARASVGDLVDDHWWSDWNATRFTGKDPFNPGAINDPADDITCPAKACQSDNDCSDAPERICFRYPPCQKITHGKICLHKDLWPSMLWEDLVLFLVMFCIGICAGATGIGGGGLNVPMLMIWSKFNIKEAVPLSHAAVMGNALAMLFFNLKLRHPHCAARPLVHYDLVLLLLPAMLAGSNLGVLTGRIFPPTLLIILSMFLLAFATLKTLHKGVHIAKDNREAKRNGREGAHEGFARPLNVESLGASPAPRDGSQLDGTSLQEAPERGIPSPKPSPKPWPTSPRVGRNGEDMLRTWSGDVVTVGGRTSMRDLVPTPGGEAGPGPRRIPWKIIGMLLVLEALFTADQLANQKDVTGIKMCTMPYWLIFGALYPIAIVGTVLGSWALQSLMAWHEERGDGLIQGEITVTTCTMFAYPGAMLLIGLVAGLLGLGGGEFMVPLMLELGLPPRVAGATSGMLMVLTTASNIIHYLVAQTLQAFLGYAISVFFIAMSGGLVGLIIRDTPYAKANSHLIVYLLATLLFVSALLLAYRGLVLSPLQWEFRKFCP